MKWIIQVASQWILYSFPTACCFPPKIPPQKFANYNNMTILKECSFEFPAKLISRRRCHSKHSQMNSILHYLSCRHRCKGNVTFSFEICFWLKQTKNHVVRKKWPRKVKSRLLLLLMWTWQLCFVSDRNIHILSPTEPILLPLTILWLFRFVGCLISVPWQTTENKIKCAEERECGLLDAKLKWKSKDLSSISRFSLDNPYLFWPWACHLLSLYPRWCNYVSL